MTPKPNGHEFHVKADESEDIVHVEGYANGELIVKGTAKGARGLAQMEKLYDMWSSEIWPMMK